MELKVTLCKSTGLTPGNSCNSIDTIVNSIPFSDMIQVTGVAVKQTKGLSVVRLPLTFEQGIEVDYAIVGDVGYWVADIQYPNDNVGIVVMVCDFFTSVGINNIEIVGGWCTRRHVQDDTPFTNVLPEPFTPQEEFMLELGGTVAKPNAENREPMSFVVATVDLSIGDGGQPYAQAWNVEPGVDIITKIGLFTPKINNLSEFTKYRTLVWSADGELEAKDTTVPYTSLFDVESDQAQTQVARMYAIGLDNVILDCYVIPGNYIDGIIYKTGIPSWAPVAPNWIRIADTLVESIHCYDTLLESNISPVFGDYKNNKVFSGQFQKIHLASPSFGDDIEYVPEDIISSVSEHNIFWRCMADLRYNGRPICYPQTYRGTPNTRYLEAVRGSEWMKSPVKQIGSSGWLLSRVSKNHEAIGKAFQAAVPAFKSGMNNPVYSNVDLDTPGKYYHDTTWLGTNVTGTMQFGIDKAATLKSSLASAAISGGVEYAKQIAGSLVSDTIGAGYVERHHPTVNFLQVPSLQNYLGNDFVDYRIRLSNGDMRRFDQFLTQYGYTVSEPLTRDCFFGRRNFNYVKADSVVVKLNGKSNLAFLNGVKEALQMGVRIWHKVPGVGDMDDNPILPNTKEAN